jgi:hypothetical protein
MLTEQEKFNAVVKNFQHLIDTNRIVKQDGLRVSHTVLLRELFEMFEEEYRGLLKKSEYFNLVRRIPSMSVENGGTGPKAVCYTRTDRAVPEKKQKADKRVYAVDSSGECLDCEMEFTNAGSAASHAKASGHTIEVRTVLNTIFNPKA